MSDDENLNLWAATATVLAILSAVWTAFGLYQVINPPPAAWWFLPFILTDMALGAAAATGVIYAARAFRAVLRRGVKQ